MLDAAATGRPELRIALGENPDDGAQGSDPLQCWEGRRSSSEFIFLPLNQCSGASLAH